MAATSMMLRSSSSRLFLQQLPSLVDDLSSDEEELRLKALEGLALLIDSSPEEEMGELCRVVRERGGCEVLTTLITDESSIVHQNALLVLGNIASERVDPACEATKQQLRVHGTIDYIVPHLWSEVYDTVLYAMGALLNLCADIAYVEMLQEARVPERLQEIAECGDSHLERFAKGCLHNIREAILQLLAMKRLTNSRAAIKLTALAMGFLARLRYRWLRALRRKLEEEAARRIQAAWRAYLARKFYVFLTRLLAAQKSIVEDITNQVVDQLCHEYIEEEWAASTLWVSRDLTHEVVDEECAAIAAECLALLRGELETAADDLLNEVVDEEAAKVAAECLEEYDAALRLTRDGLVDGIGDEQAAEVALEVLIAFEVERLVNDLIGEIETAGTQMAVANELLRTVVEEEAATVAAETLTADSMVNEVVEEEARRMALGMLTTATACDLVAFDLMQSVVDGFAAEIAASELRDARASEALWRCLQVDSANEYLFRIVVQQELAALVKDAQAARMLALNRWRIAGRRAILLNRALDALSDTHAKRVAQMFADECARLTAVRVTDMILEAVLARLPRVMEPPPRKVKSLRVLKPLRTSKSMPEVKPPTPPPPPPPPAILKPIKRVQPKQVQKRTHKAPEIPKPVSLNRLGLPVDDNGYVILPQVRTRRRMYGVRMQHASFPELRIDDTTHAHLTHLSMANETTAPGRQQRSPRMPEGGLDSESDEDVISQINRLMAASATRLLDLFRAWDSDSNGKVDKKELRQALEHLGYHVAKGELNALFAALGGGDDGLLEYGKLKRALTEASDGVSWHAGWARSTADAASSSGVRYASTAQPIKLSPSPRQSPIHERMAHNRGETPSPAINTAQHSPEPHTSEDEDAHGGIVEFRSTRPPMEVTRETAE